GKRRWGDSENPNRDNFSITKDGGAAKRWIGIGVYVFLGLIAISIVMALLLPAQQRLDDRSAGTQSRNNLKQIVLGMQGFSDTHKRLPFNGTGPAIGGDTTSGCWAFQILPFVDQGPLFQNPKAQHPMGI